MPREVRTVDLVILLVLSVLASAASWAQQPGSGPKTQGPPSLPTLPTCSAEKLAQCKEDAHQRCGSNNSCLANALTNCNANCGGIR